MNPWEILGIQETSDRRTIKKAYTTLIKQYHPEDDAEGFRRVREAYEQALAQAEFFAEIVAAEEQNVPVVSPNTTSAPSETSEAPEINAALSESDEKILEMPQPDNDDVATAMTMVQTLFARSPERNFPEEWEKIFGSDLLVNIETRIRFSFSLFAFMVQNQNNRRDNTWLSPKVWRLIDTCLNWRASEVKLYRLFDETAANVVLDRIRNAFGETTSHELKERRINASNDSRQQNYKLAYYVVLFLIFMVSRFSCLTENNHHDNYNYRVQERISPYYSTGNSSGNRSINDEVSDHFQKFMDEARSKEQRHPASPVNDTLSGKSP